MPSPSYLSHILLHSLLAIIHKSRHDLQVNLMSVFLRRAIHRRLSFATARASRSLSLSSDHCCFCCPLWLLPDCFPGGAVAGSGSIVITATCCFKLALSLHKIWRAIILMLLSPFVLLMSNDGRGQLRVLARAFIISLLSRAGTSVFVLSTTNLLRPWESPSLSFHTTANRVLTIFLATQTQTTTMTKRK